MNSFSCWLFLPINFQNLPFLQCWVGTNATCLVTMVHLSGELVDLWFNSGVTIPAMEPSMHYKKVFISPIEMNSPSISSTQLYYV